ncbi:hypothetical protein IT408_01465 [Candidatus Uhrbacteria bacterium]|nr:hypothetical protein [Candidatus Uhrbacteria bacterium]
MTFKSQFLFDRFRFSNNEKDFPVRAMVNYNLGESLAYLPENSSLQQYTDLSDLDYDKSISLHQAFFYELDFALARLSQTPEVTKIRSLFAKKEFPRMLTGLKKLKQYLETHPADEIDAPILSIVKHLSEFKLRKIDAKNFSLQPEVSAAIYLSMGILFQPKLIERAYKDENKQNSANISIPQFIKYFKEAKNIYVEKWQKTDPEGLRLLNTSIAELEWEKANPIFKDDIDVQRLKKVISYKELLKVVAQEPDADSYSSNFSWNFFIQKIWEDESLLKEQFFDIQYVENFDDPEKFIQDPRFEQTLYEIGRTLAPFSFDTKNDPTTSSIKHIQNIAIEAIKKWGIPEESELLKKYLKGVREIQWNEISAFKKSLEKAVNRPDAFEQAQTLTDGYFKDFFLFESWKSKKKKTTNDAEQYLRLMQSPVTDGARVNRSTQLMNNYVRNSILFGNGSVNEEGFKHNVHQEWLATPTSNDKALTYEDWEALYEEAHKKRKIEKQTQWHDEKWLSPKLLYVFSDSIERGEAKESILPKSYSGHLLTEIAAHYIAALGSQEKPNDIDKYSQAFQTWIKKHLPESCLLRDFYLENVLNIQIWSEIQRSSLAPFLQDENICLEKTDIDLTKHFNEKSDQGILKDAYFTKYTVYRLTGLVAKIQLFPLEEQEKLADVIRNVSQFMTPVTAEAYDRIAIELETERIKRSYHEIYHDMTTEGDQKAKDKAFEYILDYITKRFPQAGYNRDELLQKFALDYASKPVHARQIEQLSYDTLIRQPHLEEDDGATTSFAPQEAVKNYLSSFHDRESRAQILGWIFGGLPPDDRYLEGREFHVNADDEREIFWNLSNAERRVVLYNALLGSYGLFELPEAAKWSQEENKNSKVFLEFLDTFYEHNLAQLIVNEKEGSLTPTILRTIFFEVFKNYSTSRRVELFFSLTNKLRDVRLKNEKLTLGQAVKLFLEQVGVVGVKAGQVLSEHRDLVNGEIQNELSSLRDKAAPFAKHGVFTYLKAAGLSPESKHQAPFAVTEVGACLGSASIKQSHIVTLESSVDLGKKQTTQAVGKFPRPSIEKNFQEDVAVLEKVLMELSAINSKIPPRLLEEIVSACLVEFDFNAEAKAQTEISNNITKRNADIAITDKRMPIIVPKVLHVAKKSEQKTNNLQLTIEEYIPGLTFSEIEEYQSLVRSDSTAPEIKSRKEAIEEKIGNIYGNRKQLACFEYSDLPIQTIRAQVAIELLTEIVEDGIFHSDLHSGNSIIDLGKDAHKLALIDFGSVGRSIESTPEGTKDYRVDFQDFLQNVLLLRLQLANMDRLGEIVERYVEQKTGQPGTWSQKITELSQKNTEVGSFFKELLSDLMSQHVEIHPQFRLLLKSLTAAGSHLDALASTITRTISESMMRAAMEGKPMNEVLFEDPTMKKLKPFLEKMPALMGLLGTTL